MKFRFVIIYLLSLLSIEMHARPVTYTNMKHSSNCSKFFDSLLLCRKSECDSERIENGKLIRSIYTILGPSKKGCAIKTVVTELDAQGVNMECNFNPLQMRHFKIFFDLKMKNEKIDFDVTECTYKNKSCMISIGRKKIINVIGLGLVNKQCTVSEVPALQTSGIKNDDGDKPKEFSTSDSSINLKNKSEKLSEPDSNKAKVEMLPKTPGDNGESESEIVPEKKEQN